MLAGDFTAFASPACNGGRQVTLTAPVRRQPDRSSAVQPGGAGHHRASCRRRPTRAASCSTRCRPRPTNGRWWASSTISVSASTRCSDGTSRRNSSSRRRSRRRAQQNLLTSRAGRTRQPRRSRSRPARTTCSARRTLNAARFAFNRTAIHRTSTDFFSAPDVGINIYSYMPHYMLLTASTRTGSSSAAAPRT